MREPAGIGGQMLDFQHEQDGARLRAQPAGFTGGDQQAHATAELEQPRRMAAIRVAAAVDHEQKLIAAIGRHSNLAAGGHVEAGQL